MALLLKDREATPEAAEQPPSGAAAATVPDYACEACGAAMERGQDWCLECGTAAPGRLGARPGWRAAFTVVGLTTLLLLCAVVAAYAALTSDSERAASAPPTGDGAAIVATTPPVPGAAPVAPVQPGATGPNTTAPPAPPATNPIIPTQPPAPATNTPVSPPAVTTDPATPGSKGTIPSTGSTGSSGTKGTTGSTAPTGSSGTTATTPTGPALLTFAKDAAQTYDPLKRAGAEFGPAANAIDDKPGTIWDVVVPADGQPIGAGLVIDLGKPYALRSLRLATQTDGFTVEVYGATSAKQLPADVIDKRWIHLTDSKATLDDDLIVLKGKGDGAKVQLVLLYFTLPGDPTDPKVAIGDVKLRGTP